MVWVPRWAVVSGSAATVTGGGGGGTCASAEIALTSKASASRPSDVRSICLSTEKVRRISPLAVFGTNLLTTMVDRMASLRTLPPSRNDFLPIRGGLTGCGAGVERFLDCVLDFSFAAKAHYLVDQFAVASNQ